MCHECSLCDAVGFGVVSRPDLDDRVLCRSCYRELRGIGTGNRDAPLFGDGVENDTTDPAAAPSVTIHGGGVTD